MPPSEKVDVKTNIGDQQPDILDTPEQKKINDFLSQIKEKQKSIDMNLFKKFLILMVLTLRNLKRVDSYNQEAFLIEDFGDRI